MEKLKNITPLEIKELEESILEDGNTSFNNNNADLITSFFQRFKQKHVSVVDNFPDGFDLYENKFHYGKLDLKKRVIFPNENSLIKIGPRFTEEDLFLNTVAYELYLKFYSETREEIALGIKSMDDFASVYNITEASDSPSQIVINYKEKLKIEIKDAFIDLVAPDYTNILDNAKDFKSYINIIMKLFEHKHLLKDVLFSEYILSLNNSILNTGLAFEIYNTVPYDDDEQKFTEYYDKPSYLEIAVRLNKYGLRYDRNVPWRFILDLNSAETVKMMNGMSKQEFFDEHYFEIDGTLIEMTLFFEVIFLSYLELIEESPIYHTTRQKIVTCAGREEKKASSRAHSRKLISTAQFINTFDVNFSFFFAKYAKTLNILYNNGKNYQSLMLFVANNIKKGLDKDALVRYTYNRIKRKHC